MAALLAIGSSSRDYDNGLHWLRWDCCCGSSLWLFPSWPGTMKNQPPPKAPRQSIAQRHLRGAIDAGWNSIGPDLVREGLSRETLSI